jgi:hypothetical protein
MKHRYDGGAQQDRRRRKLKAMGGFALVAVAAAFLVSGPAEAGSRPAPAIAAAGNDVSADVARADVAEAASLAPNRPVTRIRFLFKKNHHDPTDSRLTLQRVTLRGDWPPVYATLGEWRAGSGLGQGPRAQDECATAQGWLPNGRYDAHPNGPAFDNNFNGGLIFGIVWHLQDKVCHGKQKVTRTDLFIHSEMTPDRKQACGSGNYRENQCWDGKHDYVSEGCIKLSYQDIREVAQRAQASGGPKPDQKHYRDLLVVTG